MIRNGRTLEVYGWVLGSLAGAIVEDLKECVIRVWMQLGRDTSAVVAQPRFFAHCIYPFCTIQFVGYCNGRANVVYGV